jgi:Na+-transporting NADH:ubiquinone oxidoreductase subunit NqrF
MDMTIVYGVAMFTAIVLALVAVILVARNSLVSSGDVHIEVNGEKTITVPAGAAAPCCPPRNPTSPSATLPKAGA